MFKDIVVEFWLRLRLFFKDRITVIVLVISLLFFLFAMGQFNAEAEKRASIPIGVAAGEDTKEVRALIDRLRKLESLYIVEGSLEELLEQLSDGYIQCVFEIREGYADKISKGRSRSLIAVYHPKGDDASSILADIVAGEMMYEICLAQGYKEYESLPEKEKEKYTRQEYEEYTASLIKDENFDFAFQFRFVDTVGGEREDGVKNSLLYRQAITAVAAMMLCAVPFVAMGSIYSEKACGIAARKRICAMGRFAVDAGDIAASFILSLGMSVVFAVCLCFGAGKEEKFFIILWTTLIFSIIMALTYYYLAKIMRGLFGFQIAGALLLLVMGCCGFCSLVEGVLIDRFPLWLRWIPNCVFLRSVTKLLW